MTGKMKYLLPSIAQSLFVILFLHMSLNIGHSLLADCDTGFHIRAGAYILDTRSIPAHDPFSFFSPPLQWPTHEWLSDVIMAFIANISGLSGVVLFFIFLISLTYAALFRFLRTNGGNILVDIVIIVLVLVTSQMHWLARPHIFTLLFLMVWYYILDSFQNGRKNYLFFLPPVMLLWVNIHGGFILGFITIAVYLLYNFVKSFLSDGEEKDKFGKNTKYVFLAAMASAIVSLINPKGIHTLLFPFDVVSNRLIMDNYVEFLSPNFHNDPFTPFRYFLLLLIAMFAYLRVKLNSLEVVLILIFVNMSLYSARYIPLFAMVAAPILSKYGNMVLNQSNNRFFDRIVDRSRVQESIDESARGYVWPVLAIVLVAMLASTDRIRMKFDEKTKPVAAVEFLKNDRFPGNMFNNDEFGDYIIYTAYPRYKVFFDGRADIYGNEKIQEYMNVANLKPGWDNTIEKYDINWIIFNTDSVLSRYLYLRKDWKLVYSDNVASIYIKNIPQNGHIIKKYNVEKLFEI